MRTWPFAALLALAFAAAAQAQPVPPPPDECDAFVGARAPPPPPAEDAVALPGFGSIFVISPPQGAFAVPTNVEVRLGGDVNALDVEPAQMSVDIVDQLGARVPFERDGLVLSLLGPLPPRQTFLVRIEATDANPCPECFGVQEIAFSTGDDVDLTVPVLEGPPPVHVFVMPSDEEAARCGLFFGQTHQIIIDFGPAFPLNTWISVAAKKEGGSVRTLFEQFNVGSGFPASGNVGTTVPTALGDAFFVAVTPRDLAGNIGAARTVRVRARSFVDMNRPREELAPLWCDMPEGPTVTMAASLPTNGQIMIEFPFEAVPVALQHGDEQIPLVAISDLSSGHVYETAVPLPAGAALTVVPLPCPRCVCEGCGDFAPIPVLVGDSADTTPPAAPALRELREDAAPPLAVEDACHPDRPAIVAILDPGSDDQASPLELRYDANIRIDGGPQLVLGRSLLPLSRGDGSVAVRIETGGFGRLLGDTFELTLEAIDAAGNRTPTVINHGGDEGNEGCAAAGANTASAIALLGLVTLARRRRAR